MRIKSFTVAMALIEEATKRFGSGWTVCEECVDILEQYCEFIDYLGDKHDAEGVEVNINDDDKTISITLECPDFVVEKKTDPFYDLVVRAERLEISLCDDRDNIRVGFTFPSLWDRV